MSAYYGLGDYQQRREENRRKQEAEERARTMGAITAVLVILLIGALGFGGLAYKTHQAIVVGESEVSRSDSTQFSGPVTQTLYRSADAKEVSDPSLSR